MLNMTRKQVSTIFKAKTRMLDIKNNFRNKYKDNICRGCKVCIETQEHILSECTGIHQDENSKVTKEEIALEDSEKLKDVYNKIEAAMQKLENMR